MELLWVNAIGVLVIGLIIYWFWFSSAKAVKTSGKRINITVNNGVYSPASIEINAGEPVELYFLRKDASPCAEKVIFSGLDISEDLPINKGKLVKIKVEEPGKYEFNCQMQMYRGSLVVK